ncbi:MAG: prolipoprotein diacylglyceryl transferase, partial [Parcubacteria group bacterium CG_4_10_14_0_2_um_filter_41_6]
MINFFHTYIPEPIAFQIGSLSIHWYGVILVVAILAGYWIVNRLSRSSGLNQEAISSIYVNTLIIGFIGARLYHVISDWGFYGSNMSQILAVWNGGLAIHGAIIGAVLSVLYFSRKYKINFWKILDIFAIAGILGQAIGRWGNYFNQELFGAPTDSWIGIPIDVAHRAEGFVQYTHFHPAFLYESLLCLAVFIILCVVFKKQTTTP